MSAWHRMPPLERWLTHAASASLIATGVTLHVMKDWLSPRDEFSVVNHPLQPAMLSAHVLLAPAFMVALGMILRRHVLPRVLDRASTRGRATGLACTLLLAPMIASGYLLQVTTHEGALMLVKWTHVATSAAFSVAFILHVIATIRARRQAPQG